MALPSTLLNDPKRTHLPENEEQPIHDVYGYVSATDRKEGLVIVDTTCLMNGDPADNFLKNVFDCDDTGRATVFVHDNRNVRPLRAELAQECIDRLGGRYIKRLTHTCDPAAVRLGVFENVGQQVFHIQHADDVVDTPRSRARARSRSSRSWP